MCGRFTLEPTAKFYTRFRVKNRLSTLKPRYNIAPGQKVPVIVKQSPSQVVEMTWGFRPHWAKPESEITPMINARIETLAVKSMFKSSLKSKRCLVPASGFYEWKRLPHQSSKQPYYIHLKDQPLFAFAGLYDEGTFTIITTEPVSIIKKIHNRMPVIINPDQEDAWLNPDLDDPAAAVNIIKKSQINDLDAYPVSKQINKPENDSPDLIKRAGML